MWGRTAGWNALLCVLLVPAGVLAENVSRGSHHPPHDLVEVVTLDSTIALDIRYATANNFMGRAMYSQARAFLQRPVAEALVRVHRRLRSQGYGIVILDAYRPWSITKRFWEETPPEKRGYVANPNDGSRHNRGAAVDVTLYDLSTGREVSMPSAYDEFSERAWSTYAGGTPEQRRLRDLLRQCMEREGFWVHPHEWWHFTHKLWHVYEILDIPFEQLD
jgi:D-alanyl-D-alanine dipeptidase